MNNSSIKISITRIISVLRLKPVKEKKMPQLQYCLSLLILVYSFNIRILMEESLLLGALTTTAKSANFALKEQLYN